MTTYSHQDRGEDVELFARDAVGKVVGGDLAGSAVLCARPVTRLAAAAYPDVPELAYLRVAPSAQGRGVGTVLIGYGERLAIERGAAAMTIGVTLDNPRARALYERLGYRPTGVLDSYEYTGVLPDGTTGTIAETAETLRKVLAPRVVGEDEVIDRVARLAATREGQTRWIGVDGWGAAGKTTLAAAITGTVPGAVVAHVDDFASPSVPEWDWDRFDAQVVASLLAGEAAHYQRWDWDTDTGAEWHDIEPGSLVVLEGVSSTRREVRAPWAFTIWVEAPREVRLRRALARDGEAMMARWTEDWMPSEEAYVARERPQERVDAIVVQPSTESATL